MGASAPSCERRRLVPSVQGHEETSLAGGFVPPDHTNDRNRRPDPAQSDWHAMWTLRICRSNIPPRAIVAGRISPLRSARTASEVALRRHGLRHPISTATTRSPTRSSTARIGAPMCATTCCLGSSAPRTKLRSRATSECPRHQGALIAPIRKGRRQSRKCAVDEVGRPVRRRRSQPEVNEVDLYLAPSSKRKHRHGVLASTYRLDRLLPNVVRHRREERVESFSRRTHVGDDLSYCHRCARFDLRCSTVQAADVLLDDLVAQRCADPPTHPIGISSNVGEHMAHGPIGKQ